MRRHVGLGSPLLGILCCYPIPAFAATCRGYAVDITQGFTPPWSAAIPDNVSLCPNSRYYQFDQDYTCLSSDHQSTFNLAQVARCGTELNKDYYGFGVRLGFYFTWFSSFVANHLADQEIPGALDANAIFLFALAISVLKGTFYDGDFMRVDAVILLLIGVGTSVGTMSLWGYRTSLYRKKGRAALKYFGGFGTHSRLLLCLCVNLYWLWFWYGPFERGLMVANCDPRCQSAWIFGHKVSSSIKWLFFTFGLLYQIYWGLMLPGPFVAIYARCSRIRDNFRSHDLSRTSKLLYKTGLSHSQLRRASQILPVLNALWFVFIIALIEITLHQNSALSVYSNSSQTSSPSQLIPLVIGVATFARILFIAYETMRYPDDNVEPSRAEDEDLKAEEKEEYRNTWIPVPRKREQDRHRHRWLRLFSAQSPAYGNSTRWLPPDDSTRFEAVSPWKVALVTWLPWLGLLDGFLGEQSLERFIANHPHHNPSSQGSMSDTNNGTEPQTKPRSV